MNLSRSGLITLLCAAATMLPAPASAESMVNLEMLEAAASKGDARALYTLAVHYERGEVVPRDFVKSNELYCKAAVRGDSEAYLKLGIIYSIGRAVMADEGVASLLLGKAAELGNERAKDLLQHLSGRINSVPPACLSQTPEPVPPPVEALPIPTAPKEIVAMVERMAPEYSIDPHLVLALISTESSFNYKAVSPKNAQGLMQLIPATAERFGVKNAFNPIDNLKGGLAYLRWLMAYFKGEVALVLAAYNAGEEAVERHRGIPPFRETINYVKQITSVYRKATHPYRSEVVAPSPVFNSLARTR